MNKNIGFIFFLMLLGQILISHLFQTGPWCVLTILPVLIFCLPSHWSAGRCMLIAFLSGLMIDFFADGIIGLNAFALTPVAGIRRYLMLHLFSEEFVLRGESFSWRKWGFSRIFGSILICTALFLLLYIVVDAAGGRAFLPCLLSFGLSLIANLLLSVPVLLAFLEK